MNTIISLHRKVEEDGISKNTIIKITYFGEIKPQFKKLQNTKKAISLIMEERKSDSCMNLFKELKILSLKSQYIFFLPLFVTNSRNDFATNLENYNTHTRCSTNLHLPQGNLAMYQKGVYCSQVKIFTNLPLDNKNSSSNFTRFKRNLKYYLTTHSFYTLDEYYTR
jgi:hypothetical protein